MGLRGSAVEIANCVGIIAEIDASRIETRKSQGWVSAVAETPKQAYEPLENIKTRKKASPSFRGNIVDLLEYADDNSIHIDLLSDQTSCHAVYDGGYCPSEVLASEDRTKLLSEDKERFKELIDETLKTHYRIIKSLVAKGELFL